MSANYTSCGLIGSTEGQNTYHSDQLWMPHINGFMHCVISAVLTVSRKT